MFEPESVQRNDELWAELDVEGESRVRERLILGFYDELGERRSLVLEWLRSKDHNEAPEVRAAVAVAAQERRARAVERLARAERRAKRRVSIALLFAIILAVGVVLVIVSFAELETGPPGLTRFR
jgi:hypothetical protein